MVPLHFLYALLCLVLVYDVSGFQMHQVISSNFYENPSKAALPIHRSSALKGNIYDDWSQDLLSTTQSPFTYEELQLEYCDEEAVEQCLEELMDSDYGKTMFGRHDLPASVGQVTIITWLYEYARFLDN